MKKKKEKKKIKLAPLVYLEAPIHCTKIKGLIEPVSESRGFFFWPIVF
jgi:hypothetical protein